MTRPSLRALASFLTAVLTATACSDNVTPGSATFFAPAQSTDGTEVDCTGVPKAQPLTGPCCPTYGVDACGSNGFCAAYDGRKTPVCYLEYSRPDLSECSADIHCASHECNVAVGKCKSLPTFACDAVVGCSSYAVNSGSRKFGCDPKKKTCVDITDGDLGAYCEGDSCAEGLSCSASTSTCKGGPSSSCLIPSDCASGRCEHNECVECSKNSDCAAGSYCGTDYRCYKACTSSTNCPKYFKCVPGTLTGSGINQCADNAQCASDAECSAGTKCLVANPCQPGGYCEARPNCFRN